jgi:hypothetical protein
MRFLSSLLSNSRPSLIFVVKEKSLPLEHSPVDAAFGKDSVMLPMGKFHRIDSLFVTRLDWLILLSKI